MLWRLHWVMQVLRVAVVAAALEPSRAHNQSLPAAAAPIRAADDAATGTCEKRIRTLS